LDALDDALQGLSNLVHAQDHGTGIDWGKTGKVAVVVVAVALIVIFAPEVLPIVAPMVPRLAGGG